MNRDEAKYILRAYQPGGRDAGDPQFREALEMVRRDPELAAWFAHEQQTDANLARTFQQFPVPPALRGQLLVARKIVRPKTWWKHPAMAGMVAACLMMALFLIRPSPKGEFSEFHSYVAETASKLDHLDIQTSDRTQIQEWFHNHKAPENFAIPEKLVARASVGCRVFAWNKQKVSLVCFELQNKKVAHLFVVDRSALKNAPSGSKPSFQTTNDGLATASWSDPERTYIMAMAQGEEDLKNLLL
jgi:hypothetical protein